MMVTIFNRRELIITYEFNVQSEVRRVLRENGIEYDYKVFGFKSDVKEYRIFVKKKDYSKASYLIQDILRKAHTR